MSTMVTKPIILDKTFADKMAELNGLIKHQNTALDILVANKKAVAVSDLDTIASLARHGELLELMDYGDQIEIPWSEGSTNYTPALNLCHDSTELLAGDVPVRGCFFEWDKTTPTGVPFDEPEAIYYFDGTESAGTYHINIGSSYGDGWNTAKSIEITLTAAPDADDQLVINCGTANSNDPTNSRTWNVYAKGSTTSKQSGTTSNGTGGTNLGTIGQTNEHTTNGRLNAISRVVYGYNRWSQSALRQRLNSAAGAGEWWTAQNPWDRPPGVGATLPGFLAGYSSDVISHFKPIKVVTVACNADGNVEDVTYDKVFLSSLEQMYCVPQFAGKEGSYWEYYKRLLEASSPVATSQTYPRLIKYAINAPTSAQYCWRRSANRNSAASAWYVLSGGGVNYSNACNACRCAPSVFISE